MKELSIQQLTNVSGGHPLVNIGIGIGVSYLYEAIGGQAGIDSYASNAYASARGSIRYWSRRLR